MAQPLSCEDARCSYHICRLTKALYGLKQAPQVWFHKLSKAFRSQGFSCAKQDNSLFVLHVAHYVLFLVVYVDNILVVRSDLSKASSLVFTFNGIFALQNLGALNYFLGIKISQFDGQLYLYQTKYICDILFLVDMMGSKCTFAPNVAGKLLSQFDGSLLFNATECHSIVKALKYVILFLLLLIVLFVLCISPLLSIVLL